MPETRMSLVEIAFSYPGSSPWRLEIAELSFPPGQVVTLLGASGAGKSTLLAVAAGVLPPQSGRVWLGTVPLGELDRRAVARRVGFLPSVFRPETELTVSQAVELGRFAGRGRRSSLDPGETDAVHRAMERTRTSGLAPRLVGRLSRGEQQRVLLASVLVQQVQFLMLDEPDAVLDARDRRDLFRGLREMAAAGTCVVVATHDLESVACFADRVVLLQDGKVVADGEVGEILEPKALRRVLGVDVVVERRAGLDRLLVYGAGMAAG